MIWFHVINGGIAVIALAAVIGQRLRINALEARLAAVEKKTKDLIADES